ncbi:CvpA family protein [Helicobacter bilis]|uniref:CvpA family protein n=1 Tax=Helicobacter bilis TaxID=37372 RepID=UPI00051E0945|nr:CvpA family protein [Helicobacter bilis]TLE08673.1 CvpA family protein [Helicobacter bilis]
METKHYVDIAVIIIVAVLGLRGLKNGLIHEIMGVLGVVLGIYFASKYCIDGAKYIELVGLSFENRHILLMFAFILILALVWIGFLVLGVIVARFVVILPEIAIINYFGGYVFSALKYFVILCVVVYGLTQVGFLKDPIKNLTEGTRSYPIMYEVAEKIMSIEALQDLQKQYVEVEETAKKEVKKAATKAANEVVKSVIK